MLIKSNITTIVIFNGEAPVLISLYRTYTKAKDISIQITLAMVLEFLVLAFLLHYRRNKKLYRLIF